MHTVEAFSSLTSNRFDMAPLCHVTPPPEPCLAAGSDVWVAFRAPAA